MFKNYLTVAFRALRKQAGYTLLNVGGLGLGLACAFLIVLFVRHERAFDRFHEKGERIHRLLVDWDDDGGISATTAAGYAQHLPPQIPEVEAAVRIENHRRPYFRVGGETRQVEETMAIADASFFDVFSFRLLRGDPATVLDDPGNLVVTESGARALFGDADPMGQVLVMPRPDQDLTFTVAGVMEDVPATSHFTFAYLAPFSLITEFMGDDALENYTNYNYGTYFLLRPGADPAAVAEKVNALEQARLAAASTDGDATAGGDGDDGPGLSLQPLFGIHFNTEVGWGNVGSRDPKELYLFGAVGLLVLLIACVNFMNLATARAAKRAREVGVRKAIGAQQGQLVGQFLGESVLLSVLAVGLGLALATLALPVFNSAMGTDLSLLDAGAGVIGLLAAIGLAAGLVAGSYPAFYLSAFQPARVLRGEVTRGQGAAFLRRGLIVGQFTVSVVLIVATLTVYRQLQFMQTRDLGFEKEQVVFLTPPPSVFGAYDAFRARLLDDPRILSVAQAGGLPGRTNTSRGYNWPGQEGAASGPDGAEQGSSFYSIAADPDYIEALGLELVAGRTFSRDVPTDTLDTYVLNEAAVAQLGWAPEEAVDQPFRAWDRPMGRVIGVVRDFHFQSLHEEVQPLVLNYIPWFGQVAIRLAPGDVRGALDHVRATWGQFAPGYVFDYKFLDADFDRLYEAEQKEGQLFAFFATVAVFIACLGLFGLAAYAAERRTKEIGVRKVLGASVRDVVLLISKEFTLLVLVAFAVAAPLAFYAMSRWLEGFAYRVDLGVGVFLVAGLLAVAVGFLTVAGQALRAASTDPVKALRYE